MYQVARMEPNVEAHPSRACDFLQHFLRYFVKIHVLLMLKICMKN
jgi:hypothetical protein